MHSDQENDFPDPVLAPDDLDLIAISAFDSTGLALEIDPFDQPGVEAGKIYSFQWLANLEGK